MPRVKKLDLGMTALDELFMNDKERAENKLPKIFDIPLSEIDDFPDHPYRVLDDEDMQNLMEKYQRPRCNHTGYGAQKVRRQI